MKLASFLLLFITLAGSRAQAQATDLFVPASRGQRFTIFNKVNGLKSLNLQPKLSYGNVLFRPFLPLPADFMDGGAAMPVGSYSLEVKDFIFTSGPHQQGESIFVYSKSLSSASTDVNILDEKGNNIIYEEADVLFDPMHNVLELKIDLLPGFYTLKIPIGEEIVSKTVIVQKP